MTKDDLERLPALNRRLAQLDKQIHNAHVNGHLVTDMVRGGEASANGRGRPITVTGYGHDKLPEWEEQYSCEYNKYVRLIDKLEQWLDTLPEDTPEDIDVKTILQYKYRNGMTLKEIGDCMKFDRSTVGKKLNDFWKE